MSTTGDTAYPGTASEDLDVGKTGRKIWSRIDDALTGLGDYLNPILVKETRQALKSRQFTASFWLVLLFAAGWSFVGISLLMPKVYYLPSGRYMLSGYFLILCVPLLLIVPFSAFRSLATECEDGTYELLSITSLSARQIVTGKLGSAILQMMVYYAALAPCIAFTYLLRGMDVGTIAVLLVSTFLVSILFSCVGLVFAGMHKSKQWQAMISVLLLLMLLIGGWAWGFWLMALVYEGGGALNSPEFWIGVGFALSIYVTVVAMLILIAAAQNSFASDNRSTQIRVTMLIQLVIYTGWMMYLWITLAAEPFSLMTLTFGGIVWTIYGAFLTGEIAELSPRARRDLPQTFFGRMFLTWFNPGSATGYVFIVGSFLALVVLVLVTNLIGAANRPAMAFDVNKLFPFAILMWSYMAFYLGLGRLIIVGLRRVSDFGVTAVFVIHVLVLTGAAAIPTFIQFWMQDFRDADYSYLQTVNWMWSLVEAVDGGFLMWPVVLTMAAAALCMFCINLVLAAREIEATRIVAPERVRLDDLETTSQTALGQPSELIIMTAEMLFYIFYYGIMQSPWGILIFVVLIFLIGTGITGLVDFRKRKKLLPSSQVAAQTEDRDQRMQEISSYLEAEFATRFKVSHFDGAYQVFAPADADASDTELFRRLSLKFPATVFSVHHTGPSQNAANEVANR